MADFSFKFTKKYKHSVILESILGYKQTSSGLTVATSQSLNMSLIPDEIYSLIWKLHPMWKATEIPFLHHHSSEFTPPPAQHLRPPQWHTAQKLSADRCPDLFRNFIPEEIFSDSSKKVFIWKLSGVCLKMHFKTSRRRFSLIYIGAQMWPTLRKDEWSIQNMFFFVMTLPRLGCRVLGQYPVCLKKA